MQQNFVTDSSSLFALERGQLIFHLKRIPFTLIIPPAVKEEIENGKCKELLDIVTVQSLNGRNLKQIAIFGFAFFLDLFHKEKLIDDVWNNFDTIIKLCHWERSEVQDANFTFLKGRGY